MPVIRELPTVGKTDIYNFRIVYNSKWNLSDEIALLSLAKYWVPLKSHLRIDVTGLLLLLLLRWDETVSLWNWTANEPTSHYPDDTWAIMEQW
jgi:hypothetical protein